MKAMLLSGLHICCAIVAGGDDEAVAINTWTTLVTKARQFTNEACHTQARQNCVFHIMQILICEAKNCTFFYFLNNFVKSRSILIIFGAQMPEWICNKTVTKLSTSPNECHYTTLWITTCAKLFITTVIQALNFMTNWQLRTNTSQQMLSVCLCLWHAH